MTFPVALAAWWQRVPLLVYLPDIEPGLAVRLMAPLATKVAVTAEPARQHFGRKAVVTGFPVRGALERNRPPREEARANFGIPADERVVLIFGGSQGAHSLNAAVGHALEALTAEAHVIHIHGRWDRDWLRARRAALPDRTRARYHLFEYLHEEMAHALVAADLVVARAGASTLGEFPAVGLPAILVPYPHSGAHQWANARFLASRGAAVIVPDAEIDRELVPQIRRLLHDQTRLTTMRHAMRALARTGAALAIYELLGTLAANKAVKRTRST
ncbi:MAG: glycosyltransferase [Ardenticatenia bacterium]|nr:glycosyltransferase [Ardenticatenia bacterium]